MKFFGLASEGAPGAGQGAAVPSRSASMLYGSAAVGAVSLLAYSIWAFRLVPGAAALYATTAAVYVGLGGLVLSRLVRIPGAARRFPPFFAAVFLVYAVGWCAFWFGLRGRHHADFWGAAAGLWAMVWLFQRAFAKPGDFLSLFAVLFTMHSLGYYLGAVLHGAWPGTTGRLLWGAAHGLGFGAGLGALLHDCQRPSA